ncbi:MAG TPA: hypothetical protein VH475_21030 [Tepidisphaeraceae bacterium]|jgi:REP element-mobilizing transposase RayT
MFAVVVGVILENVPRVIHRETVIAHHLVIGGYGHWLPNDLRGSGSSEIRRVKFEDLGSIHFGRKVQQPSKVQLREFHARSAGRLDHPVLWFGDRDRQVIGGALAEMIGKRRYTVWACAVLRDHVHLCVRIHRDDYKSMWSVITEATREALHRDRSDLGDHPIWAERPYSVYLTTPADVWRVIRYIEGNPKKHKLSAQVWGFVRGYDNWPLHNRGRGSR